MSRTIGLRRYIKDELASMKVTPEKAITEHGAWVLGVAKKHNWFPRVAAGVAAEASRLSGSIR